MTFKNLVNAIDYSHQDLSILRDAEFISEFARCFGIKHFEPLAAIMFTIDPSKYCEYNELERQYRYNKLEIAVASGDVEQCKPYVDVLSTIGNNVQAFCEQAVSQDNRILLEWLVDNISGVSCDLSVVLGTAIKNDNESLFYYLLNSGLIDVKSSDSTKWYSPMYVAVYDKCSEKYVSILLKKGFSLAAKYAYKFYKCISLDKIAELLAYNVELDLNTINRIYAEGRTDIIKEIERKPLRFCSEDLLFAAYVHCGDFLKFTALLNTGYKNNNLDLFAIAYNHSPAWTDIWLENGFDVNFDHARLLHKACEDLNSDFAIYLLENGANPRLRGQYSQTIFEKAGGFHGYLEDYELENQQKLCKHLLAIGLNPIQESRRSPSILTYLFGKTEEFDMFLVDWLGDRDLLNTPDLPPECDDSKHLPIAIVLDEFSGKYNSNVLKHFIKKGALLDAQGITEDRLFLSACKLCDLADLMQVVAAGANTHEQDKYYGINGLYYAVYYKRSIDFVKYLVELGLDVNNVRNPFRSTGEYSDKYPPTSVLDVAIQNGNDEITKYLITLGAKTAKELFQK